MPGKVKWFSQEKGYGFITDEHSGKDHFFGVRDVVGAELPKIGDRVTFEAYEGKKGPAARRIVILQRSATSEQTKRESGKVQCPHCHNYVYPRVVTHRGAADRSLCPLCGAVIKDFVGTGGRLGLALLSGIVSAIFGGRRRR